jgi:hypothetical protein
MTLIEWVLCRALRHCVGQWGAPGVSVKVGGRCCFSTRRPNIYVDRDLCVQCEFRMTHVLSAHSFQSPLGGHK